MMHNGEKLFPEVAQSNTNEISREEAAQMYPFLLEDYHNLEAKLRRAQKRGRIATDEETKAEVDAIDRERHEKHQELLRNAEVLGMTAEDVLIDIVRARGNLEDYGLPEFSILTADDFDATSDTVKAHVDPEKGGTGDIFSRPYGLRSGVGSLLPKDEVVIVFAIVPLNEGVDRSTEQGREYEVREKKAERLAQKIKAEPFYFVDSEYFHTQSVAIAGVKIAGSDLEKVAKVIRENPQEFRVGKQFYTAEENAEISFDSER